MAHRILVVDDDTQFVHLLSGVLNDAGYQCLFALDGESAIRTLEGHHKTIDLLIVDLALPKISGFEVIGAITRRRAASIRIIATSGLFREQYMEIARNLGADEAIQKPAIGQPIPAAEWLAIIRRLLDAPAGYRSNNT